LLSDEICNYTRQLHDVEAARINIQITLSARGMELDIVQIRNICRSGEPSGFADSFSELINFMDRGGGRVYSLEEDSGVSELLHIGAFTQTTEKLDNLALFGDVIIIDGTHGPLKTDWEVVPITLLHRGRHLQAGGIMFAPLLPRSYSMASESSCRNQSGLDTKLDCPCD
jgi:hypothetical protein